MNLISQFGNYFRRSPAVIIVFMVLLVALTISIGTTVEDYSTSLQGYSELPTRKINTWVIPLVAALPQVLQILMVYAYATDTKRGGWILAIATIAHVVDVGLDVFYKAGGEWSLVPISIVETEFVYTFGSEFLLTFSFALILETFPDFIYQVNSVMSKTMDALSDFVGKSSKHQAPPPRPQNQPKMPMMPGQGPQNRPMPQKGEPRNDQPRRW